MLTDMDVYRSNEDDINNANKFSLYRRLMVQQILIILGVKSSRIMRENEKVELNSIIR